MDQPSDAGLLLDYVGAVQRRVRRQHREHWLWALILALIAAGGAVLFLVTDQVAFRSCDQGGYGVSCVEGFSSFDGWAYWPLAGAVGLATPFLRRYRRGTWRPPVPWWGLALMGLAVAGFVGPLFVLPASQPVIYPVAAAGLQGVVAAARPSLVGVGACLAVAGLALYINHGLDHQTALLANNLGLAISTTAVAVLGAALASWWYYQDLRR